MPPKPLPTLSVQDAVVIPVLFQTVLSLGLPSSGQWCPPLGCHPFHPRRTFPEGLFQVPSLLCSKVGLDQSKAPVGPVPHP